MVRDGRGSRARRERGRSRETRHLDDQSGDPIGTQIGAETRPALDSQLRFEYAFVTALTITCETVPQDRTTEIGDEAYNRLQEEAGNVRQPWLTSSLLIQTCDIEPTTVRNVLFYKHYGIVSVLLVATLICPM